MNAARVLELAFGAAPAWPAAGALAIGALLLLPRPPGERAVAHFATAALWLSLLSVVVGAIAWAMGGLAPLDVRVGHWYRAGDYGFELVFLGDALSLPVALLVCVLLLATSRFSRGYLHREPGFNRFYLLMLVFASGMLLVVLGGSLDVLLAGWELVGLTSVLLVGFFHERRGPVRAALRVWVTYRLCDVGLLVAAVTLHLASHTAVYRDVHGELGTATVTTFALAVVVAAMGKSAMFPVGGWLPRAMEGPTASSAVFYGSLSVHAGVFLLLRTAPLLEQSLVARVFIVALGLITAVMATLSGQVSADAKTSLAYATIAQVGLMFAEVGLGLRTLAIVHLVSHALLRYYQFLRTPQTLQDALARRAALGTMAAAEPSRWEGLGVGARRFVYRLAVERFEVEAALERWVARPVLRASAWLDANERRMVDAVSGDRPAPPRATPKGEAAP